MNDDDDRNDDTATQNFTVGGEEKLPTPDTPADTIQTLPDDHPLTDSASAIDPTELLDEGIDGAVEAEDPSKRNPG